MGLLLAAVLICAGLTGSLAAFHEAVDGWLNPDLFVARHAGAPLPLPLLAGQLARALPQARLGYLLYRPAAGSSVHAYLQPRADPKTGVPGTLSADEVFIDPPTGEIQGMRDSDGCCVGRRALVPFLYRFHYTLGLGRTGEWIMGMSAIAWSVDCVVGLLLTLPRRRGGFWQRWGRGWLISTWRPGFRLSFDLHRAVSLWLWVVLLGIAVSGVALALGSEVFRPAVSFLLPTTPAPAALPPATASPLIGLDQAEAAAVERAAREGWRGLPGALYIGPETSSAIFYFVSSTANEGTGFGSPAITVDLRTGKVVAAELPGRGRAGDLVLQLQFPWHSGQIAGLAGRIVVAVCGIAVCVLSVTGVLIWERKRRARRWRAVHLRVAST